MTRTAVTESLASTPVVGVVRTADAESAIRHGRALIAGGLEMVEITFSVPGATGVVRELLAERGEGPPWIGMGTVTTPERAEEAVAAGAEFIVAPNTNAGVAEVAKRAGKLLVLGALTATEIVTAAQLGSDLVKVYPLPPVGGPAYLAVIRGPLSDIPMWAAGGFGVDEIPAYREVGARAFGMAAQLLLPDGEGDGATIRRAVALARGESNGA